MPYSYYFDLCIILVLHNLVMATDISDVRVNRETAKKWNICILSQTVQLNMESAVIDSRH